MSFPRRSPGHCAAAHADERRVTDRMCDEDLKTAGDTEYTYRSEEEGLDAETLLESVVIEMKTVSLLSEKSAPTEDEEVKYPEGDVKVSKKKLDRDELLDKLRVVKHAFDEEGMGHTLEASRLQAATDLVKGCAFAEAEKKLRLLLRAIRPFDIAEFLKLYGKTEEMSDALKDKSCWLMAGPTGAGKSTTIHYLAGSEMTRGDGGHIYPTKIVNETLAEMPEDAVRVGQSLSTSETRYIAGVPQDLSTVVGLDVDDRDAHVVFVDSPGFEDAAGPEMDLANGLGMVRSLRIAKRVKLVVVFSKHAFGGRMLLLKKLASTLSGILVDYRSTLKDMSVCLLTKAEEGIYEEDDLRKSFRTVFDEEKDKDVSDEAFQFLAERLSRRTRPMPAKCVWPLRPELRKDVLQTIATDCDWIESPQRAFQEFLNGDTMAKLREQMAIYKKSITALCGDLNPAKCRIISVRLSLMRKICQVLKNQTKLREYLEECEEIAVKSWNARIEKAKEALEGVDKVTTDGFKEQLEAFDVDCQALVGAELSGLKVKGIDTVSVYVIETLKKLLASLTPSSDDDSVGPSHVATLWPVTLEKVVLLNERYEATNSGLRRIIDDAVDHWTVCRKQECDSCLSLQHALKKPPDKHTVKM